MNEKLQLIKNNVAWIIPIGITILTALGYTLAYFFELGFCYESEIPSNLIEVGLSQVINAALRVTVVLGLTLIIWYVFLIKPIEKRTPKVLRSSVNMSAALFLIVLLYIFMYWDMWQEWIWLFVVSLGISIIVITYESRHILWSKIKSFTHIFRRRSKNTIKGNIKNSVIQVKGDESTKEPDEKLGASQYAITNWRYMTFFAISILIILLWTSYSIGQADAKKQDKFLTISVPQYSAVLRIYGDNMICQPLEKSVDSDTQTAKWALKGNIFIIKLSDTTEHILNLENTGRLIK